MSWIRQRDLHILTAGLFTYTSDQRFSVVQRPVLDHASSMDGATSDWILQIKFVQPRDAGIYGKETCQNSIYATRLHLHHLKSCLPQSVKSARSLACPKTSILASLVRIAFSFPYLCGCILWQLLSIEIVIFSGCNTKGVRNNGSRPYLRYAPIQSAQAGLCVLEVMKSSSSSKSEMMRK